MEYFLQTFLRPKLGCEQGECEDALFPECPRADHRSLLDANALRLAIADGASESSYSGLWAKLLVRALARERPQGYALDLALTEERIARCQDTWNRIVGARPLPWFAEEKLQQGAFAALCGVELRGLPDQPDGGGTWRAVAIGDACLLHLRDRDLLVSFPCTEASDFGVTPHLLASRAAHNVALRAGLAERSGEWVPGDCFVLATDALAKWMLEQHADGQRQWIDTVRDLGTDDAPEFSEWADELRRSGRARNDDFAMLRLEVHASTGRRHEVASGG